MNHFKQHYGKYATAALIAALAAAKYMGYIDDHTCNVIMALILGG